MLKDLYNKTILSTAIPPQTISNNTAVQSQIIDCRGFEYLHFIIATGTLTDADATFSVLIQHGDNPALSDATDAPDDCLYSTEADSGFIFSSDNQIREIGYKVCKRYARITITPSNNSADAVFAVKAILAGSPIQPADRMRSSETIENVDLFVIIGQSNAVGLDEIASAPSEYQGVITGVSIYNGSSIVPLQAGVNNEGNSALQFGPELSLGKKLYERTGKPVYFSKYAVGGTSLGASGGGWLPPIGTHLVNAKADISATIAALQALGKNPLIKGFFWMHGENDAQNEALMNAYGTNLAALISDLRSSYTPYGGNAASFIIGQITIQRSDVFRRGVMFHQRKVALATTGCQIVYTGDLTLVSGHFQNGAEITLGNRMADAFVDVNDFPTRQKVSSLNLSGLAFIFDSERTDLMDMVYDTGSNICKLSQYNGELGNNGVQANATFRPLIVDNNIKNRDTIQFNGTNRFVTFGTSFLDSVIAGANKQFTMMGVIRPNHAASTGTIFGKYWTTTNQRGFVLQVKNGLLSFLYQTLAATAGRGCVGNTVMNTTSPYVFVMTYDGTQTGNNGLDRVKMWINGVAQTLTLDINSGSLFDINNSAAQYTLGAWSNEAGDAANGYFNGDICEFEVLSNLISDTDRQAFEAFATAKWLP